MRIKSLFTHTLREAPAHATLSSHKLLTRAGYFQEIGKGGFAILPLGRMALQQIENSILALLQNDSNPVELPLIQVHEGGLVSEEGLRFKDSQGRHLQIMSGMQSSVQALAQQHLYSYRQLPSFIHYSGSLWEDEVFPGSGLFYSRLPRSFGMTGFFLTLEDLFTWRQKFSAAVEDLLNAASTPYQRATGIQAPDGSETLEWYFPHPAGRTLLFTCPGCGYNASSDAARFARVPHRQEDSAPIEKVATPNCKTIEDLATFLQVPKERTAKAVFLIVQHCGKEELVIVMLPGDRELDEARLVRAMGASGWRPATEDEIETSGAVPGYGSPIGIENAFVAVDTQITSSPNLVAGANQPGYHFLNVNYGRDYHARLIAEITHPKSGDSCPHCGVQLHSKPALQIAALSQPVIEHGVMDLQGKIVPIHALSLQLNATRLLAAIAEANHDEHGLMLPPVAAPFQVYLALLQDKEGQAQPAAEALADQLEKAGLEPLFDDRSERAGVKFNDADLIGAPLRIIVSQRSLAQGLLELKLRSNGDVQQIPQEQILEELIRQVRVSKETPRTSSKPEER